MPAQTDPDVDPKQGRDAIGTAKTCRNGLAGSRVLQAWWCVRLVAMSEKTRAARSSTKRAQKSRKQKGKSREDANSCGEACEAGPASTRGWTTSPGAGLPARRIERFRLEAALHGPNGAYVSRMGCRAREPFACQRPSGSGPSDAESESIGCANPAFGCASRSVEHRHLSSGRRSRHQAVECR